MDGNNGNQVQNGNQVKNGLFMKRGEKLENGESQGRVQSSQEVLINPNEKHQGTQTIKIEDSEDDKPSAIANKEASGQTEVSTWQTIQRTRDGKTRQGTTRPTSVFSC